MGRGVPFRLSVRERPGETIGDRGTGGERRPHGDLPAEGHQTGLLDGAEPHVPVPRPPLPRTLAGSKAGARAPCIG
jgi:hypothetical protein